ncbi:MAG: hypothetical protein OCD02_12245 [Spirochaetaceae bacterium]
MNNNKTTELCYEIRRFIGAFDVSTHLHARFIYWYMLGEGIPDVVCSAYELSEMYSYGLIVEGLEYTYHLNDENVGNIKLLFLFNKLEGFVKDEIKDPMFWNENLMLFVE